MSSLFHQAFLQGEAEEVHMNESKYVSFTGKTSRRAIGTRNLNSCTAVIIASRDGAYLAHIAPLPYPTTDPSASKRHAIQRTADLIKLRETTEGMALKPGDKAGIVCAIYEGQEALPGQVKDIDILLQENVGVKTKIHHYLAEAEGHTHPRDGTVFVDGRQGIPKVYVEDHDKRWF